jgi:hypothetical protein
MHPGVAGCISDYARRAFTAEGADSAGKIEKRRSFLSTLFFLSVLSVLSGKKVLRKV